MEHSQVYCHAGSTKGFFRFSKCRICLQKSATWIINATDSWTGGWIDIHFLLSSAAFITSPPLLSSRRSVSMVTLQQAGCARVTYVWACRWCKSRVGWRVWGCTPSRTHWRMLQCRIQAKPAGLHFSARSAPYVHTDGQKVTREGLGRVPGWGWGKLVRVYIKPASFCPYSVADFAVREELEQQGGWEDRPSTSCPSRSQRAALSQCQRRLPSSAEWSGAQQLRYEMPCDAPSTGWESLRRGRMCRLFTVTCDYPAFFFNLDW